MALSTIQSRSPRIARERPLGGSQGTRGTVGARLETAGGDLPAAQELRGLGMLGAQASERFGLLFRGELQNRDDQRLQFAQLVSSRGRGRVLAFAHASVLRVRGWVSRREDTECRDGSARESPIEATRPPDATETCFSPRLSRRQAFAVAGGAPPGHDLPVMAGFEEILDRARRGERDAVQALMREHLPALRAFVRLQGHAGLRARESSSDLVQTVCREVLEDLREFRGQDDVAFRHWLYTVARNKLLAKVRFHRAARRDLAREEPVPTPEDGSDGLLTQYGSICTPSQHAMAREEIARIEAAVDRLNEDQRQVLTLSCIVGLSHREISREIGKEEAAVRKILSRARARLGLLLALGESSA